VRWPQPPIHATFLRRYKRFFADFRLPNDDVVTAHCPNTGSMKTCLEPDAPAILTYHDNPKRKLKYSWQSIKMGDGWVGINTSMANDLVREAILAGRVSELQGYDGIQRERPYAERSRVDLLLTAADRADCYVEVKNVTLRIAPGVAAFPDAVTKRGTKHLQDLQQMVRADQRAVLFFCVQREGIDEVRPADDFDPTYCATLREAHRAGVEVLAYRTQFEEEGPVLVDVLPVKL